MVMRQILIKTLLSLGIFTAGLSIFLCILYTISDGQTLPEAEDVAPYQEKLDKNILNLAEHVDQKKQAGYV